jgi:hypothetical protein
MPKGKKKQQKNPENGPSAAAMVYSGPIKFMPGDSNNADMRVVTLHETSTNYVTSNVSGVLSLALPMNPSSAADWSNWAGAYSEYRLLGCDMEFFPQNRYSKSGVVTTPILGAVTHQTTSSAPNSYTAIMALASARKLSLEDPWKIEWRMTGAEEASFKDTAAPAFIGSIYLYSDGLTVSTTYGRVFIYWLVQFRGRT